MNITCPGCDLEYVDDIRSDSGVYFTECPECGYVMELKHYKEEMDTFEEIDDYDLNGEYGISQNVPGAQGISSVEKI